MNKSHDLAFVLRRAQDLAIMVPREGWDVRRRALESMAHDLADAIPEELLAYAATVPETERQLLEAKAFALRSMPPEQYERFLAAIAPAPCPACGAGHGRATIVIVPCVRCLPV